MLPILAAIVRQRQRTQYGVNNEYDHEAESRDRIRKRTATMSKSDNRNGNQFAVAHSADKPRKTITLRTDTARWFRKCGRQHTRGNGSGLDCGEIAPGVKLESVALVPLPPAALKQSERLRRFRLRFLRQRQQMARFTPHRPSSSWTPVASEARSFDRCNAHRIGVYSPCIASNEDH